MCHRKILVLLSYCNILYRIFVWFLLIFCQDLFYLGHIVSSNFCRKVQIRWCVHFLFIFIMLSKLRKCSGSVHLTTLCTEVLIVQNYLWQVDIPLSLVSTQVDFDWITMRFSSIELYRIYQTEGSWIHM
jgi:hypothetical protein